MYYKLIYKLNEYKYNTYNEGFLQENVKSM